MKRFFQKHIKIFVACALLGIVFFVAPQMVGAQTSPPETGLSWWEYIIPTNWIPALIYAVTYFLFSLAGEFLSLMGSFLNFAQKSNVNIIHSQIALTGWLTVRDLANLAIVVAVIFIAVATIIGREEYGIRKFLGKLIVMALLINFTFVISGLFIDFSSVFTAYFYNNIVSGDPSGTKDLSTAIAASLKISNFLTPSTAKLSDINPFVSGLDHISDTLTNMSHGPGLLSTSKDMFFTTIFFIIAGITMANIAVLFFIRYIAIVILLILAPLAWIMYAFPGLEHFAKQWWRTFLEWIFFLPVSMFFIYLAVLAMLNFSGSNTALGAVNNASMGGKFAHLAMGFGFLFGAMMAGKFVGGASAEMGMNVAGSMKGVLTGVAGGVGGFALSRYLNRQVQTKDEHGNPKTMSRADAWKLGLTKRGFVGAANAVGGMAGSYSKRAEGYKDKYSQLNGQETANVADAGGIMLDEERLAIAQQLSATHAWRLMKSPDRKRELLAAARSQKDRNAILSENPELIAEPAEAQEIVKHMTTGQIAKIGASAWQGESAGTKELVRNTELSDLEAMQREGNKSGLGAAINALSSRIKELRDAETQKRIAGLRAKTNDTGAQHEVSSYDEEIHRLNGIIKHAAEAPSSLGATLRSKFGDSSQIESDVEKAVRETKEDAAREAEEKRTTEETARSAAAAAEVTRKATEAAADAARKAAEERERRERSWREGRAGR